jgi:DhnA family fructose-bisphosphate aldolase class Ia
MKRRMYNLLKKDGKAFLVAMDHGLGLNVQPELDDPGAVIQQCREGNADGFLTSLGTAERYSKEIGDSALLVRADGGSSELFAGPADIELLAGVEDAIRVGADGIVCMAFPGATNEMQTSRILSKLVSDGLRWNLPVGVETLPRGFEFDKFQDCRSPKNLQLAARIGCEYGADFIKTQYTGDKESFKALLAGCYRPVLILGGGSKKEERALLQEVKDALDCGAAGVIMGRNIYRHKTPVKLCKAIAAIVHQNASVDQAISILK